MKIIIIGANEYSYSLIAQLSALDHDLMIVDNDLQKLSILNKQVDVSTTTGNVCSPITLANAGAIDANLLIAITDNEEVNLLSCILTKKIFNIPKTIARLRSQDYLANTATFNKNSLGIDVVLSQEQLVAEHIQELILNNDLLFCLKFYDKKISFISVVMHASSPMINMELSNLDNLLNDNRDSYQVIAIYRQGDLLEFMPNTIICELDEIHLLCLSEHVNHLAKFFKPDLQNIKNIVLVGGGHIGQILVPNLEKEFNLKVIENNQEIIEGLSKISSGAVILQGSGTDNELLNNEEVGNSDVFCAITNSDQVNIISCILAKKLGAKKTIAIVNNESYAQAVEQHIVDVVVIPQQITMNSILTHVGKYSLPNLYVIKEGSVQICELIVKQDLKLNIVGKNVDEIEQTYKIKILSIIREQRISFNINNLIVSEGDHFIVCINGKDNIAEMNNLLIR